jgi:hypothetical protein
MPRHQFAYSDNYAIGPHYVIWLSRSKEKEARFCLLNLFNTSIYSAFQEKEIKRKGVPYLLSEIQFLHMVRS